MEAVVVGAEVDVRMQKRVRGSLALAILAAVCLAQGVAEGSSTHLLDPVPKPVPSTSLTPERRTRHEVLVDEIKKVRLSPVAMETLEKALDQKPRLTIHDFHQILAHIETTNRGLLTPEQVTALQTLYQDTLASTNGESGKELAAAIRKLRQETEPKSKEKGENKAEIVRPKERDPGYDALTSKIDLLMSQLGRPGAQPPQSQRPEAPMRPEDDLFGNAAMLKLLANKDGQNENQDGAAGRPSSDRFPFPQMSARDWKRDRDQDKEKHKKDSKGGSHDKRPDRNRGQIGGGNSSGGNNNGGGKESSSSKKGDEDKQSMGDGAPSKPLKQDNPDSKTADLKKKKPSNGFDSYLNSMGQNGPPPRRFPLPPAAKPGFGPVAGSTGGYGGGYSGGGGGPGPSSGGSKGGFSDPFPAMNGGGNSGFGFDGDMAGGRPMSYPMVKDVGFLASGGGDFSSGDSVGEENDDTPSSPARLATFGEQIDMTPPSAFTSKTHLLQRKVGHWFDEGTGVCADPEGKPKYLCKTIKERHSLGHYWSELGRLNGIEPDILH